MDKINIQMDEVHRARYVGRSTEVPCCSEHTTLPAPPSGHPPGSSPNPILLGCLWRLHHVNQLLAPFPAPLPYLKNEGRAENSKLLITAWIFWLPAASQKPNKSHFITKRTLLLPRKFKGT